MGKHWSAFIILGLLFLASNRHQPACAQAAADWPSFRGNPQLTGVADATVSSRQLRWTYETGSSVESTAAIVGDTVYVGTMTGALLALDLADGSLKWKFLTEAGISASPCVVGDAVYVGDEGGTFYAIKRSNGELLWEFQTGGQIISSATPAPGAVLVGSYDYNLYKLDAATGQKKWAFFP